MKELKLNIAESSSELFMLDEGLILLNISHLDERCNFLLKELSAEYIQFHFVLEKNAKVHFNQKKYTIDVLQEQSLLIYNPTQNLPLDIEIPTGGRVISLFVKIVRIVRSAA